MINKEKHSIRDSIDFLRGQSLNVKVSYLKSTHNMSDEEVIKYCPPSNDVELKEIFEALHFYNGDIEVTFMEEILTKYGIGDMSKRTEIMFDVILKNCK